MHEDDPRFAEAVAEFNHGRYFEAHELWEELWKEEPEGAARRIFYQGLIQVAAGYHKLRGRQLRGGRGLLGRGLAKLLERAPGEDAIDVGALRRAVEEDLRRLEGRGEEHADPPPLLWPRIEARPPR